MAGWKWRETCQATKCQMFYLEFPSTQSEREWGERESLWWRRNRWEKVRAEITSSHFMLWLAETWQLLYLPFNSTTLFSHQIKSQGQWEWWPQFIGIAPKLSLSQCTIALLWQQIYSSCETYEAALSTRYRWDTQVVTAETDLQNFCTMRHLASNNMVFVLAVQHRTRKTLMPVSLNVSCEGCPGNTGIESLLLWAISSLCCWKKSLIHIPGYKSGQFMVFCHWFRIFFPYEKKPLSFIQLFLKRSNVKGYNLLYTQSIKTNLKAGNFLQSHPLW